MTFPEEIYMQTVVDAKRYEMRVTEQSLFFHFYKQVVIKFMRIDNLLFPPIPSIKPVRIKTKHPSN